MEEDRPGIKRDIFRIRFDSHWFKSEGIEILRPTKHINTHIDKVSFFCDIETREVFMLIPETEEKDYMLWELSKESWHSIEEVGYGKR